MSILAILNRLEAATGRLEKEAILKTNSSNQLLKDTFRLALDPTTNFYIKQIPEPASHIVVPLSLGGAFEKLSELSSRSIRGDQAKSYLARTLGALDEDDQEVLKRVIGRSLKCGVSEGTVEKVWPYMKLSYPCMLVSPMNEKTKLKFPMIAQTKMDGMRINAVVEAGAVTYRSRNGKEFDIFGVLDEDFLKMAAGENLVFDGELLVWGTDGKPMDRKTGNGLLTKFQKGTGTPEIAQRIRAMVWDRIPLTDFRKGTCQLGYSTRLFALNSASNETSKVKVLKTTMINSISIAQTLYQEQLAQGEEGIILKDPEGIWEDKRVKHQVKMKAELEADLLVTGFTPGTGKYEGKIGSLEVQSADGKVKTSVGTGLSDEERSLNFKEFMGKIAAVKYNALISDKKTGASSMFLPVFVELREDKTVADIL